MKTEDASIDSLFWPTLLVGAVTVVCYAWKARRKQPEAIPSEKVIDVWEGYQRKLSCIEKEEGQVIWRAEGSNPKQMYEYSSKDSVSFKVLKEDKYVVCAETKNSLVWRSTVNKDLFEFIKERCSWFCFSKDSITLGPKTALSHIDERAVLSHQRWSIAIISGRSDQSSIGSRNTNPKSRYYHAQIVVEGLAQGAYFMKVAHIRTVKPSERQQLRLEGDFVTVRIADFADRKDSLDYEKRSEVWKITDQQGSKLLQNIVSEKTEQEKKLKQGDKTALQLSLPGSRSLINILSANVDSCIGWSVKKIQTVVALDTHWRDRIATDPEAYTPYDRNSTKVPIPNHHNEI